MLRKPYLYWILYNFLTAVHFSPASASTLPYAEGFVGQIQQYRVRQNESLIEIARRFDLGFNEIMAANPGVNPFIPKAGTVITIPSAWIVPASSVRPALLINLPEYRMYYFTKKDARVVITFPLGIGDEGRGTPLGSYTVIDKIVRPAWHVPASIRRERPDLPKVVPPGPENPMGSHALRLSKNSILIHGTNRPWGIGRKSSHGCLRLYPEDIRALFETVPEGLPVIIVDEPIKIGRRGEKIFLEVHADEHRAAVGEALQLLAKKNVLQRTDFRKVIRVMEEKKGIPVDITLSASTGGEPAASPPFTTPSLFPETIWSPVSPGFWSTGVRGGQAW